MKVLIVWPNKDAFGFLPVNIALLSALLKANGHEVELFDTRFSLISDMNGVMRSAPESGCSNPWTTPGMT